MSYRIQVDPEASEALRTLRAHVVQQVGRLLGELAELVSAGPFPRESDLARLEVDDCVLLYQVDRAQRTLNVRSVQRRALGETAALA